MHTGGKEGRTTMGVQICVAHNLYILDLSISPGGLNDLNRLSESRVPQAFLQGTLGREEFKIGDRDFGMQYLLADSIYPRSVCVLGFT